MSQVNYHLMKPQDLNNTKWDKLRPQFIEQMRAYEKEIGGIDMGMGFFLRKGANLFFAEKNGKMLGWMLGGQGEMARIFMGQKAFVPEAIYIIPEERFSSKNKNRSFNDEEFANKLFDKLRKNNFDFYYVRPDYDGVLTKKGAKYLKKIYDVLEKRLKQNEGFWKKTIAYAFAKKSAERRYKNANMSGFEKRKRAANLKLRKIKNKIKRKFRK
jgi:hypothetical protein